MSDRIIDISEGPAKLSVDKGVLVIYRDAAEARVPFAEIGVLMIAHPAVGLSGAVLSELCEGGASCVVCNSRFEPTGMLLPLQGNHVQQERFEAQASAALPAKKRIWQQIVRAKIAQQICTLESFGRATDGLASLMPRVGSGDPQNMEAQAARKYWRLLFGNGFQRNADADDQNRHLNYGYAIVRAITTRSICAAGLHPSLGLHHKNRYDIFCLASDLMEPYRPFVDGAVAAIVNDKTAKGPLDKEIKYCLINAVMTARVRMGGEIRVLPDALQRTASSLAAIYARGERTLALPEK